MMARLSQQIQRVAGCIFRTSGELIRNGSGASISSNNLNESAKKTASWRARCEIFDVPCFLGWLISYTLAPSLNINVMKRHLPLPIKFFFRLSSTPKSIPLFCSSVTQCKPPRNTTIVDVVGGCLHIWICPWNLDMLLSMDAKTRAIAV